MMDVNIKHCHPQPSSLSLRCRWGVSHCMQGKGGRTSGEHSSVCASMLLSSCFMRCRGPIWELYVGCVLIFPTAVLPFHRCSSTNVYEHTCYAHHSRLMTSHLVRSCLVRPWLSVTMATMVPKWDTGTWRLRNNMKVVLLCSILPFLCHSQPSMWETCCFCESFSCMLGGGWSSWTLLINSAQEEAWKDFQQRAFVHANTLPPWLLLVPQKHPKKGCHHFPMQLCL